MLGRNVMLKINCIGGSGKDSIRYMKDNFNFVNIVINHLVYYQFYEFVTPFTPG